MNVHHGQKKIKSYLYQQLNMEKLTEEQKMELSHLFYSMESQADGIEIIYLAGCCKLLNIQKKDDITSSKIKK